MINVLIFLSISLLSLILSIAVHELGHLVVGLAYGFRFYLLIVGPFALKRNDHDRVIFYFEKNVMVWGGLGATVPRDEDLDNFRKFRHILLSGPGASIVFGAVCIGLAIVYKSLFVLPFGAISLSMGIASLLPIRAGAFYTDGGRWLRMGKTGTLRNVELAIWNITQCAIVKGNYKDIKLQEIVVLTQDKDIRTRFVGHCFKYYFYKDNNDSVNAEREKAELEILKPKVPKQMISMSPLSS